MTLLGQTRAGLARAWVLLFSAAPMMAQALNPNDLIRLVCVDVPADPAARDGYFAGLLSGPMGDVVAGRQYLEKAVADHGPIQARLDAKKNELRSLRGGLLESPEEKSLESRRTELKGQLAVLDGAAAEVAKLQDAVRAAGNPLDYHQAQQRDYYRTQLEIANNRLIAMQRDPNIRDLQAQLARAESSLEAARSARQSASSASAILSLEREVDGLRAQESSAAALVATRKDEFRSATLHLMLMNAAYRFALQHCIPSGPPAGTPASGGAETTGDRPSIRGTYRGTCPPDGLVTINGSFRMSVEPSGSVIGDSVESDGTAAGSITGYWNRLTGAVSGSGYQGSRWIGMVTKEGNRWSGAGKGSSPRASGGACEFTWEGK